MVTDLVKLDLAWQYRGDNSMSDYSNIIKDVEQLYRSTARKYGNTPIAVGWKDYKSQELRFSILSEIGIFDGCSVLDVGCGYGAFYEFLIKRCNIGYYLGIDIVKEFIDTAKKKYKNYKNVDFLLMDIMELNKKYKFDFVFNCGIFHVKFNYTNEEFFEKFVKPLILKMWEHTRIGMAFTFLTDAVDYKKPKLFYCSPSRMFEFLRNNVSKYIVLRHDYKLFEYTVYVYREGKDYEKSN